jgi:putative phosphoribosyl transferase
VDDGLATGSTLRAAAAAVRSQGPEGVIVAVPVAPAETCASLRVEVDEVVCLFSPVPFISVGASYENFSQITDEEVRTLLERAATARAT